MAVATAREATTFVRRTSLEANEYHTNFRKVDCETISRLTSEKATRVTSQMCKVYLSLVNAPAGCWEREGVLRFAGEEKEGRWVTAWEQLVALAGVASATARKALRWMHEVGIVGYFAGKNGVGIRVFMNRASSSIGRRPEQCQKNLRLVRASTGTPRTSAGDIPFNDSYAVSEVLETDINPHAPKDGADNSGVVKTSFSSPENEPTAFRSGGIRTAYATSAPVVASELPELLLSRLEPVVRAAAAQAAAREHERTREWLESRGLPKAARVAQREAYNVLRQHGLINIAVSVPGIGAAVGRKGGAEMLKPQALSPAEVKELAETCVAMLEVHGKPIEVTLAELSAEAGGLLLAEDVPKVRELARALASAGGKEPHLADLH